MSYRHLLVLISPESWWYRMKMLLAYWLTTTQVLPDHSLSISTATVNGMVQGCGEALIAQLIGLGVTENLTC